MADSLLASIVSQIKTILETVSNVGNVHAYQRLVKDTPAFNTAFQHAATASYRFWEIHRISSQEAYLVGGSTGVTTRTHVIQLDGFMGVDDSANSESTFQTLVESVCDVFRGNTTLNHLAASATASLLEAALVQVARVDHVKFGDRLLHHAEVQLTVRERITYT